MTTAPVSPLEESLLTYMVRHERHGSPPLIDRGEWRALVPFNLAGSRYDAKGIGIWNIGSLPMDRMLANLEGAGLVRKTIHSVNTPQGSRQDTAYVPTQKGKWLVYAAVAQLPEA